MKKVNNCRGYAFPFTDMYKLLKSIKFSRVIIMMTTMMIMIVDTTDLHSTGGGEE